MQTHSTYEVKTETVEDIKPVKEEADISVWMESLKQNRPCLN